MVFQRIKALDVYFLFLIAAGICFVSSPVFAASRGILIKAKNSAGFPRQIQLYCDYHALVVGCADYRAGWPRLPHPVDDAREVAATLKQLDWEVELLENPGWDQLDRALNRLITVAGRSREKAVLFWFSGHGHTLEEADGTKLGYIVPVDAPRPVQDEIGFMRRAIDMRQIETVAMRIRAKHVLMVFDSCFSGALFSMVRAAPSPFIEEKIAAPVREFITAGRENEAVPDRSVFKICFIQGIRDGYADLNKDGYVTGVELGAYLQEQVINYSRKAQHPQFGKINNPKLDKGDFVFVLKPPEQMSSSDADAKVEKTPPAEGVMPTEDEQLQAIIEQRKGLEAERRRLELEKQAILESRRKEHRTPAPASQNPQLAYIPDEVQAATVSLRKEPQTPSRRELKEMLLQYNFFDAERNPAGYFANDFIVNADGTITDRATGLVWQKSGSSKSLLWFEAKRYVEELNDKRFAGYSDWRLPTIEELASILTREKKQGLYLNDLFDNKQKKCWSVDSLPRPGSSYYEDWIISFSNGTITDARNNRTTASGFYYKDQYNHVRAVRSLK
jgi:hypothetical protein